MACNVLEIHPCDRHVHPGTCTAWRQRTINFIFKGCRFYDIRVVGDGGKRKTLNWFWCKRSPFTYLLMEVKVKSTIDNGYICESISLFCRQSVQRTKGQGKQGAFVNQALGESHLCSVASFHAEPRHLLSSPRSSSLSTHHPPFSTIAARSAHCPAPLSFSLALLFLFHEIPLSPLLPRPPPDF